MYHRLNQICCDRSIVEIQEKNYELKELNLKNQSLQQQIDELKKKDFDHPEIINNQFEAGLFHIYII